MSFNYEISISIDVKDVIDGIDEIKKFSYNWVYNSEIGSSSNILIGILNCDLPLSFSEETQICDIISTRIKQNMPNYTFSIQCVRKY